MTLMSNRFIENHSLAMCCSPGHYYPVDCLDFINKYRPCLRV